MVQNNYSLPSLLSGLKIRTVSGLRSACPKPCEKQDSRRGHETCRGKQCKGVKLYTACLRYMRWPYFPLMLKRQKTGPVLVPELTIVKCPQKHKKAEHQANEHIGYEVWVIHKFKSKCQISKSKCHSSMESLKPFSLLDLGFQLSFGFWSLTFLLYGSHEASMPRGSALASDSSIK